jgi:hypothetical protein
VRIILFILLLPACARVGATEKILAPSPNKAVEAVVVDVEKPSEAEVIFRLVSSKRKIGSFPLGGYSAQTEVLWSPDGKYAALQRHFTRHTTEVFVFRVAVDAFQQVKIQDYVQNIYGRLGLLHGGRGFVDKPLKWLAPERLLISATGTLDREDRSYHYEVEIRIIPDGDQLIGWLEKISSATPNE